MVTAQNYDMLKIKGRPLSYDLPLPPIRGPTDKVVAHYRVDGGCDRHCHVNRNITRIKGGSSIPVHEPLSFHEIQM